MTTRKQTAPATPATQVVQQPEMLPYYLEVLRPIFELLERFVEGDKGVQEKLRTDIATARQNKDHKGNIDAALGKLVVIGGLPISLFSDVLDEKSARWLTRKADEFVRCAAETDTTIQTWSREEARRVLDLYRAKNRTPAKRSVIAILAAASASAFSVLESWAYPRPRATKEQTAPALQAVKQKLELETKLTALEAQESAAAAAKDYAKAGELATEIAALRTEMANLTATAAAPAEAVAEHDEEEVDETPSIEEQIAELETQKDEAVKLGTAEGYARAGELATQIAALRQEAEAEVAPSATITAAAPVVATAAAAASPAVQPAGTSEFTVDDAIDLCTSATASGDLKRLLARRQGQGKTLSEADFVKKVRLLANM